LIALAAALVAAWLALQVLGFLLKVALFIAAVVVAVAAFRSWHDAAPREGPRY
jgi:hypothetical protein